MDVLLSKFRSIREVWTAAASNSFDVLSDKKQVIFRDFMEAFRRAIASNLEAGESVFGKYADSIGRLGYELYVFQRSNDVFVFLTRIKDLDGDNDSPDGGLYNSIVPPDKVITVRTDMCFSSEGLASDAGSRAPADAFTGNVAIAGAYSHLHFEMKKILLVSGTFGMAPTMVGTRRRAGGNVGITDRRHHAATGLPRLDHGDGPYGIDRVGIDQDRDVARSRPPTDDAGPSRSAPITAGTTYVHADAGSAAPICVYPKRDDNWKAEKMELRSTTRDQAGIWSEEDFTINHVLAATPAPVLSAFSCSNWKV